MDQGSRRPLRRRCLEFRTLTEGVGALIYARNTGRYLFLLRTQGSWPMTWGLAGGKIDTGESVAEGLNREIQEELGGKIVEPKFVPVEMFTSNNEQFVYHTYFVAVDYEFVPKLNHEHVGYAWLPLDAAPKPLHPGVNRTLTSKEIMCKIHTAESNYRLL
jgi:8-oxo-dGTP pyrophosphatase MutT (NUDIX family)